MKMKKYIAVMCAASVLAACSDWDDHYDANPADTGRATETLWQSIKANPELSDFASLAEKAGYADLLSSSQALTVWAPVNGSFDVKELQKYDKERLAKEFLENHIARNNYTIAGDFSLDVKLLNSKMKTFSNVGGKCTMGDLPVSKTNQPGTNGVLHLLNGQLSFFPNVYETLTNENGPIDSISDYIHDHDAFELDLLKSTPGPVVDGEITYLDSVFIQSNTLFWSYDSHIFREDSSYTMIVPTNDAWAKAKAKIEPYYNYLPQFKYYNYLKPNVAENSLYTEESVEMDAAYMRDSLIHQSLMSDLFYNNKYEQNGKVFGKNYKAGTLTDNDSVCSTTGSIIYGSDIDALLEGSEYLERSNGNAYIVDSLRMRPWTSWCPVVNAEFGRALTHPQYGSLSRGPLSSPLFSRGDYYELTPETSVSNPLVAVRLNDVRSATYAVYVIVVPNFLVPVEERLPNRIRMTVNYTDNKGGLKSSRLGSNLTNDVSKVDTLYYGDFTFPVCTAMTGYAPYIVLQSYAGAGAAGFDRTLRFDKVMLVPKELDDYMKEHPDYKPGLDASNAYRY